MRRLPIFLSFLLGLFLVFTPTLLRSGSISGLQTAAPAQATELEEVAAGVAASVHQLGSQTPQENASEEPTNPTQADEQIPETSATSSKTPTSKPARQNPKPPTETDDSGLRPFSESVKGTQKLAGLFTLYSTPKKNRLLAEIKPEQLNLNYLWTTTLESGIGESGLYRGLPIGDFLFYFRRVNNNLQFTVRNVNFRARLGDPLQRSVTQSFTDSVLYSLPIRSIHPQRQTLLVDLGALMMSDVPGLSTLLTSILGSAYTLDANKSYLGNSKAFPYNLELESIYNFSGRESNLSAVPDSRALTLKIRYSISQLPERNSYRPRLADERVGYFITAYKDFSTENRRDPFVRYINRWQLEKQDPKAPLSKPKQPIVFWIENTVPLEYRAAVRDGTLMWNRAFEKIGFKDAIEVKQMPDNAAWDPADIRYNTIRWFNSLDATFAMGPSRVNPLTGQILDADIIVDASFVGYSKRQYQIFGSSKPTEIANPLSSFLGQPGLCNRDQPLQSSEAAEATDPDSQRLGEFRTQLLRETDLCYSLQAPQEFMAGSVALDYLQNVMPNGDEMKTYVNQFLRQLIAHEVGHTLGLRHNFHGSTLLQPEELNNPAITHQRGLVSSVMDYNPPNLAPQGTPQGDYYPVIIGPYDEWAIEYGYKPIEALVPQAEVRELEKIAQRSTEPALAYATDEDWFSLLDPNVDTFDLSGNGLTYSRWQMDNAQAILERLDRRFSRTGDSFSEAREVFDTALMYYFRNALSLPTYIAGQSFRRSHIDDPNGRLPFEPVPLEQQRQALALMERYIFDESAFQFSPTLLNKLAPSRWNHWGSRIETKRLDYPIHDRIFLLQNLALRQILSGERLGRLRDAELQTGNGQTLTLPELFDSLQTMIWKEVVSSKQSPLKISSLRRASQRAYMNHLIAMVLRQSSVPEDARTLAWYKLRQLKDSIGSALQRVDGDISTRAHLEESRDRIAKALDAPLQSQ